MSLQQTRKAGIYFKRFARFTRTQCGAFKETGCCVGDKSYELTSQELHAQQEFKPSTQQGWKCFQILRTVHVTVFGRPEHVSPTARAPHKPSSAHRASSAPPQHRFLKTLY